MIRTRLDVLYPNMYTHDPLYYKNNRTYLPHTVYNYNVRVSGWV